eukprot:3571762-Heterocapsa_arctica.AAC.1
MNTAERIALRRELTHKRTPADFENLAIACQGAPESCRAAIETMANVNLKPRGSTLAGGDTGSSASGSGLQ